MFKKILVTFASVSLFLGTTQANSLRDVMGSELDRMNPYVRHLDLGRKGITEITPDEGRLLAEHYPNLIELNLNKNNLTSVPAEIFQIRGLVRLSLSNNQLTHLPGQLGQLKDLKELSLSGNELSSVPAEIGELRLLESLLLDRNQLQTLPAQIWQLSSLGILYLAANQLTHLPAGIGQLRSLRVLLLSGNQLTSIPEQIGELSNLYELQLNDNSLISLPEQIGKLTNLEIIYLGGNRFSPEEIAKITAALPSVTINGADRQKLQSNIKPEDVPAGEECGICRGDNNEELGPVNYRTNCEHYFHVDELSKWIHSKDEPLCPVCRQNIYLGKPLRSRTPIPETTEPAAPEVRERERQPYSSTVMRRVRRARSVRGRRRMSRV